MALCPQQLLQKRYWMKLEIRDFLNQNETSLNESGIGTARLDVLVLLEDALGKDRSWILANPDYELEDEMVQKVMQQVERRKAHVPLAYIRGFTEFYGRKFKIDERALEPRPESEAMIDLLKALPYSAFPKIFDIGTGSGAIGITAALEIPGCQLSLIDIDPACLDLATENVQLHGIKARIREENLAENISEADVLLCNLPYVPDNYEINEAALHEPRLAIYGGKDGLDLYRTLFSQIKSKPVSYVLTEALPFQHQEILSIAHDCGYEQIEKYDFIQVFQNT